MVIENRTLAVWGDVGAVLGAVLVAMTIKGKIVLFHVGVIHQGRDLLQTRIVVVVVVDSRSDRAGDET